MIGLAKDPRVKAGAPCRVKRRGYSGQGFVWVDGKFKEIHGKGAFIVTDKDQNSNFYHWSDIQYVDQPRPAPSPQARSLATIGDALLARSNGQVTLAPATPDRSQIAVIPDPPKPPPTPPTKAPPPSRVRQRAPSTAHRHRPTAIGDALRKARQDSGQIQLEAAKAIGISATRVSLIETGAIIPLADELVLFAAHYDLPLERLESLAAEAEPVPVQPGQPAPPAPPAPARAPAPAPAPAGDYVAAIAAVIETLAPLTIAERRAILEPLLKIL